MKKIYFLLLTIFLFSFSSLSLNAFSVKRNAYFNKNVFGVEFPNGTSFYAAANLVSGVSMQRYVLGFYEVSEVVVDINSSVSQLRIYAVTLVGSENAKFKQEVVASLVSTGEDYATAIAESIEAYTPDVDNIVIKEYPATTHSKTVEYKVNVNCLEAFYKAFSTDYTKTASSTDDDADDSDAITSFSKTSIGGTKYAF